MTQEFYAVVKTAINNTNWDESQKDIVDRVLLELEELHKSEVKPIIKIEGLETPPSNTTTSMPDSIANTIITQAEVLRDAQKNKVMDPADLVMEEPLGKVSDDELRMEEASSLFGEEIK